LRVFIVLAIRGYEPLYRALQIWKVYAWFFEHYCLVFYILGTFLIKQLFHSCLLDMRRLKPTQHYAPCWLSIISYPTRSCGIIDNYSLPHEWCVIQTITKWPVKTYVPPVFLKQKSCEYKKILYHKIQKSSFAFSIFISSENETLIEQWNCLANRLFI